MIEEEKVVVILVCNRGVLFLFGFVRLFRSRKLRQGRSNTPIFHLITITVNTVHRSVMFELQLWKTNFDCCLVCETKQLYNMQQQVNNI